MTIIINFIHLKFSPISLVKERLVVYLYYKEQYYNALYEMNRVDRNKIYIDWVDFATRHLSQEEQYNSKFELFNNEQFRLFFRSAPAVALVVNHVEHVYEFFSENCKEILGYEAQEFYDGKVEFGVSKVLPEHAKVISDYIFPSMFNAFEEYSKKVNIKDIRISFNFKFLRKDGSYIWVSEQMSVLEADEEGNPLLSMYFLSDINNLKKDEQLDFAVSLLGDKGYFEPVKIINYPENKTLQLSEREMEILSMIGKGYSSEIIAQKLNISPHTVKTHRRNMLDKTGAQNTSELLFLMTTKGLI